MIDEAGTHIVKRSKKMADGSLEIQYRIAKDRWTGDPAKARTHPEYRANAIATDLNRRFVASYTPVDQITEVLKLQTAGQA